MKQYNNILLMHEEESDRVAACLIVQDPSAISDLVWSSSMNHIKKLHSILRYAESLQRLNK